MINGQKMKLARFNDHKTDQARILLVDKPLVVKAHKIGKKQIILKTQHNTVLQY